MPYLSLDVPKLGEFIGKSKRFLGNELFPGKLLCVWLATTAPADLRIDIAGNAHFRQRGCSLRQRWIILQLNDASLWPVRGSQDEFYQVRAAAIWLQQKASISRETTLSAPDAGQ